MTDKEILLNYIETSQPDVVAKYIQEIREENKQLKEQLTIKEKAIDLLCEKVVSFYSVGELAEGYGCNRNYYINKAKESMKDE